MSEKVKQEALSTSQMMAVARRLIGEVAPSRWKILTLSFVCMLGVAGFTGALAYATKFIVDDVFSAGDMNAALKVALVIAAIAVCKAGFQYANEVIIVVMQRGIAVSYQKRLFARAVGQDMKAFAGEQATAMMTRLQELGRASGSVFVNLCNRILVEFLTVLALFVVMLMQNPLLTLICSVSVPAIFWLIAWLSSKTREVASAEADILGRYFAIGTETLRGIKTVKSYQLEDKTKSRFNAALDEIETLLFRIAKITSATLPVIEFLGGLIIGLFVIFASWQVTTSEATPGEFTAFIAAFLMAYRPAERLSDVWVKVQKGAVFSTRMFEILDTPASQMRYGTMDDLPKRAPLVADNLHFAFEGGTPALTGIGFEFEPGERIAVIGASGAGKSTLIDILQRFHDPDEGQVQIGTVPLPEASPKALRNHVSYISQAVFLFDGTIADNIRDGQPNATLAEIDTAARLAGLGDVVDALPKGLDTPIGPNGAALSGGQRQRLGIARGIIKPAGLYIFDEVTSALDTQTERDVLAQLTADLNEAILLFVTHRPATLDYVDRVLVLKDGALEAFDTQSNLARTSATFRDFFGS